MSLLLAAAVAASNRNSAIAISSLGQSIVDAVDYRIAGKNVTDNGDLFDNYYDGGGNFTGTRNPDVWCADIPTITGIAAWGSYERNLRIITLIAPDVGISARHIAGNAGIPIGTTCKFLTADDEQVTLTIEDKMQIGSTDLDLFKFTTSAPSTIGFARVLSVEDWATLLTDIANGFRIPTLYSNQLAQVRVGDMSTQGAESVFQTPIDTQRLEFYTPLIGGDSGHPCTLICSDQIVLLTTWHYGTSGSFLGSGPSIHYYRDDINAGITELGSVHRLYEVGEDIGGITGATVVHRGRDQSDNETGRYCRARAYGSSDEWIIYATLPPTTGTESGYDTSTGTLINEAVSGHPFNSDLEAQIVDFNGSGISLAYDPIRVRTVPQYGVTGVTVGSITSTGATLSFTPGTIPLTGYHAYYREAGDSAWILGGTAAAGATTITITGLTGSTDYEFDVAAYNSNAGFADAETALSGTPAEATTGVPALSHSAQRAAYGASYAWRGDADAPSVMGAVIGGIDATANGSPYNIFGQASLVSGETDTAVYISGSTGNCKIVATGLTLALPITIELFVTCSTGGCLFALNTSGSTPHAYLYTNAFGGTGLTGITLPDMLSDSTRHHIFVVIANGSQKVYVDNVLVGSTTDTLSASLNRISLGAWYGNSGEVVGVLDEPCIYPSALSAGQIETLFIAATT